MFAKARENGAPKLKKKLYLKLKPKKRKKDKKVKIKQNQNSITYKIHQIYIICIL